MNTQKPGKAWYFIGCKPQSVVCDYCKESTEIAHSLELHNSGEPQVPRGHACLKCAEELVRNSDKGLPTWAESITKRGGMGYQGWTSRWHWEDRNGPWEPVDVGAARG
jgi:hypothetical protein